jgi:hypothetical protein
MQSSSTVPDILVLQEVWGRKGCSLSPLDPPDYETLFHLMKAIRDRTGVSFRIAHLRVRFVQQGPFCGLLAGNAVLYNPGRLRNTTDWSSEDVVWKHDDSRVIGTHLRASLPCLEPSADFAQDCSRIDGRGLTWTYGYHRTGGGSGVGPSFASFTPTRIGSRHIHVYNIHHSPEADAAWRAIANLARETEARFGDNRLYPPILAGDFNVDRAGMECETSPPGGPCTGWFPDFEIAAYATQREAQRSDVMGVLGGEIDDFPARFGLRAERIEVLPVDQDPVPHISSCGNFEQFWSDHCGLFVAFGPK